METKNKMYLWLGNRSGYIITPTSKSPEKNPEERLKFMGFTFDVGWPKKMNTGRLLHKPSSKSKRKNKKYKKKLN